MVCINYEYIPLVCTARPSWLFGYLVWFFETLPMLNLSELFSKIR